MCKTPRENLLKEISINNNSLINEIIEIIYKTINVDLYKEFNNKIDLNNTKEFKKTKSFYKQTIKRLLNVFERYSMKEQLLLEEVEKGQRLVEMKKAATVQSPNYGSEASFNEGYRPNTYEIKLHAIEEEIARQNKRIEKYDDFVKQHKKEKEYVSAFVELSPNTPGVEVIIRHFMEGQPFKEIADIMKYEEVYYLWKRAADDLAMILMFSL